MDKSKRLPGLLVDEQVIERALGIQLIQDIDGAIVKRYRSNALTLAIGGRDAPYTILLVNLIPGGF